LHPAVHTTNPPRHDTANCSRPAPGSRPKKNTEASLIRSSAVKYLFFVAASGQGSYEISFTRHFYQPPQLRTFAEISADIF
jgi:type I restriction enzyme M protein